MRDGAGLQWNTPGSANQLVKMLLRFPGQRRKCPGVHVDFFFARDLDLTLVVVDVLAVEGLALTALTDVVLALLD